MIRAINITLSVLVAFSVGLAALLLAVLFLHVLVIGGLTVYHLLHS